MIGDNPDESVPFAAKNGAMVVLAKYDLPRPEGRQGSPELGPELTELGFLVESREAEEEEVYGYLVN